MRNILSRSCRSLGTLSVVALALGAASMSCEVGDDEPKISFDRRADGSAVETDLIVNNDEWVADGVLIVANPDTEDCGGADDLAMRSTLVADHTVLTSAANDPVSCNNTPLTFYFMQPVRHVDVRFVGDDAEYELSVADLDGEPLGAKAADGAPGEVRAVTFTAGERRIGAATFGGSGQMTAVTSLDFDETDGTGTFACGDIPDVDETPPGAGLAVEYSDDSGTHFLVIEQDTTLEIPRSNPFTIVYSAQDGGGVHELALHWKGSKVNPPQSLDPTTVPDVFDTACSLRLLTRQYDVDGVDSQTLHVTAADFHDNHAMSPKLTVIGLPKPVIEL